MWKQLRTPNLDPVVYVGGKILYNWLGWCLAVAQVMFGVPRLHPHAWAGWNATAHKHRDRNLPKGVYVPIWFDGWWNGQRYGHVAIYKDGKIWSSPISNKPYADVWTSIEQVERNYGMTYVGWSEDIGGVRVVEFVNNNITLAQLNALFAEILERAPDQAAINYYVGKKTYDVTRHDVIHSPERNQLLAKKEADRLAVEEAKRKAEEARLAAEKAAAEAKAKKEREEAERLAEEARRAQEEADRLAEEERKKKEEQAKEQIGDVEGSDEPFTGEEISLLKRLVQLIMSLINKLTGKEK